MKTGETLNNWIPYQMDCSENEISFRWIFVGDKKYSEPFFHETTAKCRVFEENRHQFKSTTTSDGLIEYAAALPSLDPTAFVFHVSRCGSTLLTQLLSIDSQNIVLAEPPILDDVLRKLSFENYEISEEKKNQLIRAVIKLLGQKRTSEEQKYFIKLDSWHIFYYEKLRMLFPNTPFIFSFRRPDEVIRSQVKEAGMHAAPGVIEPALFGFKLEEILQLERPRYIAKVLEKYFECYLKIVKQDTTTLFINYGRGMLNNLEKIEGFLEYTIPKDIREQMLERTKFHSKLPNKVFEEPILDTQPPDYQKPVIELYCQLEEIVAKL